MPDTAPPQRRWAAYALACAVLLLLGLSIHRSYSTGQHLAMYDTPIYRWRESLAIALSRLHENPLHGYLGYGSVSNYLNRHGLALMVGEADPLPTRDQWRALVFDGPRMEKLITEASRVPIDASLAPVVLKGNELGLVDYYYWAFRLFGLNLNALTLFYYALLSLSVLVFFLTFRHSPFCLLLLMLYLAGHFYMVGYASAVAIKTVHNSRFFPVLSLLPAMHLLLLLLRRARPRPATVGQAAVQAFLLMFVILCRTQAVWQAWAILACAIVVIGHGVRWNALRRPKLWPAAAPVLVRRSWPALLVAAGLAGLWLYTSVVPDQRYYSAHTRAHMFWHPLYSGTVSADPELFAMYNHGEGKYTDGIVYRAVLDDLRQRNDTSPSIAYVRDGMIQIDFMKDTVEYDRLVRDVFLRVLSQHPWLVVKSFLIGKPADQIRLLRDATPLFAPRGYILVLPLAIAASLLASIAGLRAPDRIGLARAAPVLVILLIFSSLSTLVVASVHVVDTILLCIILAFLAATYLPAALLPHLWRRRVAAARQQIVSSAGRAET